MMSADLLRRAAKVLREHAEALPATMAGSWRTRASGVVADDGTDVGMLVVDPYNPDDDAPVMAFIALMHPPVALALADLLDAHIPLFAGLDPVPDHEVFKLARAILREPEATT